MLPGGEGALSPWGSNRMLSTSNFACSSMFRLSRVGCRAEWGIVVSVQSTIFFQGGGGGYDPSVPYSVLWQFRVHVLK